MRRPWCCLILLLLLLALLEGCYLVSGPQVYHLTPEPDPENYGQWTIEFVSADGEKEETLDIGRPSVVVYLRVSLEVEWGELALIFPPWEGREEEVELIARYGSSMQHRLVAHSDEAGLVHYRVRAYEASNGTYTLAYRFIPPPTPTPTPTATPTPTPP